ncbi:hypothetical protein JCM24511_07222 [Saitozyma sp. JCM 24511]|nr:hypothetical protein JCM24511_07222 [Saitozyma sp. JCM 24511]
MTIMIKLFNLLLLTPLLLAQLASGLGEEQCITFPSPRAHHWSWIWNTVDPPEFVLASQGQRHVAPILVSSSDDVAVHRAAQTFAQDVLRVTDLEPTIFYDTLPKTVQAAIIVGTISSPVIGSIRNHDAIRKSLAGKWESYDARWLQHPLDGLKEAIVISGSDRRGTIYALHTLAEQMGVSPFHFWADVPVSRHSELRFDKTKVLSHGEPTAKYRGLFINDEHPALWSWAQARWDLEPWTPAFQTWFYELFFDLMLRLKANYHWPAMYASMFAVDGVDVAAGLPDEPFPGPNQILANDMGIIMGTSHHEPMSRNKPEWDEFGIGRWDYLENTDKLRDFWRYGATRAKDMDTIFTVGMRGDGDEPLRGASNALVENVMILFSDDNYGNIMSVMPPDKPHPAGAGLYYHVDYVGVPRAYKWINTVNPAKTWEQLNVARSYNTTAIWLLNIGTLKPLEVATEWFLHLAWDSDAWPRNSVHRFHEAWASREFGVTGAEANEVADIVTRYSMMASRCKAELVNSTTWSLTQFSEAERIMDGWSDLSHRSSIIYDALPDARRPAYYQLVHQLVLMQTNLNRLYISAGRSNLYAEQGRTAANVFAKDAIAAFEQDANLTAAFHSMEGGKWDHMLDQTHLRYTGSLEPLRDTLPPISFVQAGQPSRVGIPLLEHQKGHTAYIRVTVEGSTGSWPGDVSCAGGSKCSDPVFPTMDPYGASRWFDVGSGGPKDVTWTATTNVRWLTLSQTTGGTKGDGTADSRVYVTVDWERAKATNTTVGSITVSGSDRTNVTIAVPIMIPDGPPDGFNGFVQGDGYVVMEAAHYQDRRSADGYSFEELVGYGRTLSGIEVFPVDNHNSSLGRGPWVLYNFWSHESPPHIANITVQIAPTLNYLAGKEFTFGIQMDDQGPMEIRPIPTRDMGKIERPPGAHSWDVGAVPVDWWNVVEAEIRNVTLSMTLEQGGWHNLTLWGMTSGVIVERIWIDMGGIASRGYSYLGPPESRYIGAQ